MESGTGVNCAPGLMSNSGLTFDKLLPSYLQLSFLTWYVSEVTSSL